MEPLKKDFDVIVVGAGTGGTTAARFAANEGLSVCLIERKPETLKPPKICGDAVGKEIFDILDIAPPEGDELSCHIKGAKLYTPNREKSITMIDPKQTGYIIDRLRFGQRLLQEALDAGVEQFLDKTTALDLVYDGDSVGGVRVKLENGEKVNLSSKVVIDASGLYSPLRKKIKSDLIENDFDDTDAILCYREIVQFPTQAQEVKDVDYISIILDQEKAPGGYIWYFPKNEYALNIGLGVYMDYGGKVKDLYRENVFKEFIDTDKVEIHSSGGGVAPVRRPLWSCADDGIMFVGDAGLQVNPLHGGGIDPSMRGGYYAALTAADAIEKGDYALETLWNYNVKIMRGFGAEFAGLDLLRRVLQSLSNADLNFGLEKNLLTASEILEIAESGDLSLSLWDMAFKAFKGMSRPDLLLDLNYLRIHMNEIIKLYRNFPEVYDPQKFESWKLKVKDEYDKIKKMIVDGKKAPK